ncbi:hypothetical protein GCM10022403_029330 [Streptomyces coacervatus]|uniref:Uncharacterized protein n=1 Tax=Streptomyces coacervatus TaxID=647381 RepID=A0ABP7HJI8_9ACTN|nr:hypothetical protein [Streptomyces coacervatus]MDF2265336.1 hypothetical protein [Streptomyces coacervatus]
MVDLPVEVTGANPAAPQTSEPPVSRRIPRLLPAALALLVAVPVLAAVHAARPAPYGDRFTAHGHYVRDGRRPLAVLPADGYPVTLWDDGLVTADDGASVRWHRALPAADDWLPARGGTGVLRPVGRGILAVVTPPRITGYRIADGDLRWVVPAREGCAFAPERAVRHAGALIVAQPCPTAAWTSQLIAVDDLGRITPHRTPLGNGLPGRRPEHPNTEKVLAHPR